MLSGYETNKISEADTPRPAQRWNHPISSQRVIAATTPKEKSFKLEIASNTTFADRYAAVVAISYLDGVNLKIHEVDTSSHVENALCFRILL